MKICIYCGKENPETKDHIPPKSLFAKPRPVNLKTVPCCSKCHRETTTDDEYFRNMLAMRNDTFNHPDVKGILPKVHRALANPKQRKFTSSLANTIKRHELKTKSGIYIGDVSTYDVDKFRLDKVVERITRGLYWTDRKKIFPINGEVRSFMTYDLTIFESDTIERITEILSNGEEKIIGNKTLKYRFTKSSEGDWELWLLTFYERVEFLVFLIFPQKEKTQHNNGEHS